MKLSEVSKITAIGVLALMGSFSGAAYAQVASPSPHATGVTAPAGTVEMGGSQWVSDHLQGFCRLDKPAGSATYSINSNTCVTVAVSPGQPSYDANTNFVYVPDNSSKSQGVWRLKFDPATKNIITSTRSTFKPVLLAPGKGLAGVRTTATALGPNGLYVGSIKSGNIVRITNPAGATTNQQVQKIGSTSDGRGIAGMTLVGTDLYLAEGGAVSAISIDPKLCRPASPCVADPLVSNFVIAPTAITSNGTQDLYIADVSNQVIRYTLDMTGNGNDTEEMYVPGGTFRIISGLGMAADKTTLFVGDDPTDGNGVAQGRMWQVVPPTPATR